MPATAINYKAKLLSLPNVGQKLYNRMLRSFETDNPERVWRKLQNNPYAAIAVNGIGFKKADRFALEVFELDRDDPVRHEYGNRYCLEQAGVMHVRQFEAARSKNDLYDDVLKFEGVTVEKGMVWLPRELKAECKLVEFLRDVVETIDDEWLDQVHQDAQTINLPGDLNREQALAIQIAQTPWIKCMALMGAAGTGKTHTLATLAKVADKQNLTMAVMAFSGKASNRAKQLLAENGVPDWLVECSTIHRGIGITPVHPNGSINEIEADIVVLDEASMIPNWLMAAVIGKLKPDAKLVLVGDPAQLPPIGYGQPFQDFLDAGIPRVELTQNYRQADQQAIYELCDAVRNNGEIPAFIDNFFADEAVQLYARSVVADRESNNAVLNCFEDLNPLEWQVIAWKNDEVEHLNIEMQNMADTKKGEWCFDYRAYSLARDDFGNWQTISVHLGDKVMVTSNDYTLDIFNGETYIIAGIKNHAVTKDSDPMSCLVLENESGEQRYVPIEDASDLLRLGYAVTTHKAQGSGWHTVIVFQSETVKFNSKRWWYTSLSRAAERLYVFTDMAASRWWANATATEKPVKSTLLRRLAA
ncbi:MAG: AAA family ATPase [Deinococcota bacterium]